MNVGTLYHVQAQSGGALWDVRPIADRRVRAFPVRVPRFPMRSLLAGLLLCVAAGAFAPAGAQDAGPRFRRLGLADGLSQSTVLVTLRSRDGRMWIGTEDGLNRSDGYRVTVFKHDPVDAGTLSDSYVTALHEDRRGRLWVGTSDGGLNRLDPATGRAVAFRADESRADALPHDRVTGLAEDAAGRLWIATRGDGLVRLDHAAGAGAPTGPARARFTVYRHADGDASSLPGDDLLGLTTDAAGTVWVGAFGGGLGRLDPATGRVTSYRHDDADPASLPSDMVSAVLRDRRGAVWVGFWGAGLARLPADDANRTDGRARFEAIVPDATDPRSLTDGFVRSLYETPDASATVWVGTASGGAALFSPHAAAFRHVRRVPGHARPLADDYVRAFALAPDGRLWVGTRSGLCAEATPGTAAAGFDCTAPSETPDFYVRALASDADGTLWIGGPDALYRRAPSGAMTRFAPGPDGGDASAHRVYAVLAGRDGLLWVGARSGLWAFDRATSRFVRHLEHDPEDPASLADSETFALAETPDGALWIGTARGLHRLDRATGRLRAYRPRVGHPESLAHDRVLGVTVTRDGRLWASTVAGLCRLDDAEAGRFTRVGARQGLADDLVYAAVEDASGHLWISGNRGLARLDVGTGRVRRYTARDGLQSDEFNQGAASALPDGSLAFGGVAGYTRFRPEALGAAPPAPPLVLTGVRVLDRARAFAPGQPVRIGPGETVVAFEWAALEFVQPEAVRYRYRLDGFDRAWRGGSSARTATFTNLAGGRYTLRVQAANADGRWGESLAVPLVVTPPWWATGWARLAGLLLAVGMGVAWHRTRMRAVERRRDEATEVARRLADAREAERRHLARELHDGPMQDLLTANLRLGVLAQGGEPVEPATIGEVQGALGQVRRQLRDTCGALRPPSLGPFGLGAALRAHAEAVARAHPDVRVEADVADDGQALPEAVRLGLFRIAQEAVANAVRHAAPSRVGVRLSLGGGEVRLTVEDDGRGFRAPARFVTLARAGHYGLLGMAERAAALGATLTVDTAPGDGTRVTVRVAAPTPEELPASLPDTTAVPAEAPRRDGPVARRVPRRAPRADRP